MRAFLLAACATLQLWGSCHPLGTYWTFHLRVGAWLLHRIVRLQKCFISVTYLAGPRTTKEHATKRGTRKCRPPQSVPDHLAFPILALLRYENRDGRTDRVRCTQSSTCTDGRHNSSLEFPLRLPYARRCLDMPALPLARDDGIWRGALSKYSKRITPATFLISIGQQPRDRASRHSP